MDHCPDAALADECSLGESSSFIYSYAPFEVVQAAKIEGLQATIREKARAAWENRGNRKHTYHTRTVDAGNAPAATAAEQQDYHRPALKPAKRAPDSKVDCLVIPPCTSSPFSSVGGLAHSSPGHGSASRGKSSDGDGQLLVKGTPKKFETREGVAGPGIYPGYTVHFEQDGREPKPNLLRRTYLADKPVPPSIQDTAKAKMMATLAQTPYGAQSYVPIYLNPVKMPKNAFTSHAQVIEAWRAKHGLRPVPHAESGTRRRGAKAAGPSSGSIIANVVDTARYEVPVNKNMTELVLWPAPPEPPASPKKPNKHGPRHAAPASPCSGPAPSPPQPTGDVPSSPQPGQASAVGPDAKTSPAGATGGSSDSNTMQGPAQRNAADPSRVGEASSGGAAGGSAQARGNLALGGGSGSPVITSRQIIASVGPIRDVPFPAARRPNSAPPGTGTRPISAAPGPAPSEAQEPFLWPEPFQRVDPGTRRALQLSAGAAVPTVKTTSRLRAGLLAPEMPPHHHCWGPSQDSPHRHSHHHHSQPYTLAAGTGLTGLTALEGTSSGPTPRRPPSPAQRGSRGRAKGNNGNVSDALTGGLGMSQSAPNLGTWRHGPGTQGRQGRTRSALGSLAASGTGAGADGGGGADVAPGGMEPVRVSGAVRRTRDRPHSAGRVAFAGAARG